MNIRQRPSIALSILLSVFLLPKHSSAQVQLLQPVRNNNQAVDVEQAAIRADVVRRGVNVRPLVGMVEQVVFAGVPSAEIARQRFQRQLTAAVAALDRDCELQKPQRDKLLLAGAGDIARLFDRVDDLKIKFDRAQMDQENFRKLVEEAEPLKQAMAGDLFRENSLFQKVWRQVALPHQLSKLTEHDQQANEQRRVTLVQSAVASLERDIPLSQKQRQKLLQLLTESTRAIELQGDEDFVVFRLALFQIPANQLSEILDQAQIESFKQNRAHTVPLENFLKQRGFEMRIQREGEPK